MLIPTEPIWGLKYFSKNISVYVIFNDQNFNDRLTNDIVNFEQLGPDVLSEKLSSFHSSKVYFQKRFSLNDHLNVITTNIATYFYLYTSFIGP